jgi:UDP-GlcNAc3NAcA epimerase
MAVLVTKIIHVVGARPQFVKAAPVSPALAAEGLDEILVHTGQHYDWLMSEAFFEGLNLPEPAYNLGVGSAAHGAQTGRMLEALEKVMLLEQPDIVLVHGDTNSTIAGALAAVKLHFPVAHVEAGLRSFNRRMPEEINRIVTDHVSTLLFAPTENAVANLAVEGITQGVIRVGDVMYDLVLQMGEAIDEATDQVLDDFGLSPGEFALVTIHRPENTDDPDRWTTILESVRGIAAASLPVVWLVHPRTRDLIRSFSAPGVHTTDPLPYLAAQTLVRNARVVLTDSGGLQKEAALHCTPCVTFRDQTEWAELVEAHVNQLAPPDAGRVIPMVMDAHWPGAGLPTRVYGGGTAAVQIARSLARLAKSQIATEHDPED